LQQAAGEINYLFFLFFHSRYNIKTESKSS
jgi:hypothetical protein